MKQAFDCLIVGAGPAGLATALELIGRGWSVLVIDKAYFPREKVCGGFIGPENKGLLSRYGVLDELVNQGAKDITHVFLSAPNGDSVRVPIGSKTDGYALGFSRKMLDALLLEQARRQGVVFNDMTVMQNAFYQNGYHTVSLKNMRTASEWKVKARHLVRASGAAHRASRARGRLFGVSALFDRCRDMQSNVIMHFISQGHAGINRFEKDRVNVCYVIKEELFKRCEGRHEEIWSVFLKSNPWMRRQMGEAQRLTPWKTTYLDMDMPRCFFDGSFHCVGDAAGLIHPVAGGGISMALNSGSMLGGLLGGYNPQQVDTRQVTKEYQRMWHKRYLVACTVSRWAGALGHHKQRAQATIKLLKTNEIFITSLFKLFHKRPQ